jgi:hypothetical protein
MIMCRTLNSDIDLYNSLEIDEEDTKEETGWKLVHGTSHIQTFAIGVVAELGLAR